jgi:hypothetical protein
VGLGLWLLSAVTPLSAGPRHGQTFKQARADFEAAWKEYLPKCSQADFDEYRRSVAWTSWKYAMWSKGCRMPTQSTDGRSRCFCGEAIDIGGTENHVHAAHMAA